MKTVLNLVLLLIGVSFSSLLRAQGKLGFISDTLRLVTERGVYGFDIKTRSLFPLISQSWLSSEDVTDTTPLSLEYESREGPSGTFFFWRLMLDDGTLSREVMNFDTKPQGSGYILYPFGWSRDSSSVYLRNENGDAVENEQGIWEFDLNEEVVRCILPKENYIGTPILNRDRTQLLFVSREGLLSSLTFATGSIEILLPSTTVFKMDWIPRKQSLFGGGNDCSIDEDQPLLHTPFRPETEFCVTRIGFASVLLCDQACSYDPETCSLAPYCEGHCEAGCVNCRDAVDMNVTDESEMIIACAAGYVIRVQEFCPVQGMGQGYGFGYHVVVRHGDPDDTNAPQTLYAHLDNVFVELGEFVFLGQPLGEFGNTQALDCDGDGVLDCDCPTEENSHLHLEYHENSVTPYGGVPKLLLFVDVGDCVVQPNNSYTSGYEAMSSEYTEPSSDYTVSVEVHCDATSYITFTGESC